MRGNSNTVRQHIHLESVKENPKNRATVEATFLENSARIYIYIYVEIKSVALRIGRDIPRLLYTEQQNEPLGKMFSFVWHRINNPEDISPRFYFGSHSTRRDIG